VTWDPYKDFKKDDYVTLTHRGDVWRVETVIPHGGFTGVEDMLHLEWVAGSQDPGRIVKYGSTSARKLTAMEVIALSART
jgi:hypothetical protein